MPGRKLRQGGISRTEEIIIGGIHQIGINLGVVTLALASLSVFVMALIQLFGIFIFILGLDTGVIASTLGLLGVERRPLVLAFVNIIDTALLGAILLVLAFGLKAVFMGKCYKVLAFDIRDLDELKEHLVGLIITLLGTRFLEQVLRQGLGAGVLDAGIGVGVVILALGAYDLVLKKRRKEA